MSSSDSSKSIKIAIAAMGGQGGGVLSSWIVALAEHNKYLAQYTSIPGVAQRTGATIYYIELFPEQEAIRKGQDPVMALMPVPGDVDIVIAGEMVEAGRALSRGLVTPEQTSFIYSSHRLYSQLEKQSLGDGRTDTRLIATAAHEHSMDLISFDMDATAQTEKCMISAVLYGALAASKRLPFTPEQFKQVIVENGVAVEANLAGFSAGCEAGIESKGGGDTDKPAKPLFQFPSAGNEQLQNLLDSIQKNIPEQAHEYCVAGVRRLIDYQDIAYAEAYIERLLVFSEYDDSLSDAKQHNNLLAQEVARHLALWMSYEDTIRVADLKTRLQRFTRYKKQGGADSGELSHVVEFMHPRVEEIADTMPAWVGSMILNVKPINRLVNYFCGARMINTSKLSGFLLLRLVAKFKGIRRSTLRFKREHQRIYDWIALIRATAQQDYLAGVAITKNQNLIKGYGDTLANGWMNYQLIVNALPTIMKLPNPSTVLAGLRDSALADDLGEALKKELKQMGVELS